MADEAGVETAAENAPSLPAEHISKAETLRESGKGHFQRGDYKAALADYHQIYMWGLARPLRASRSLEQGLTGCARCKSPFSPRRYVNGFSHKGSGSADMLSSLGGGSSQTQVSEEQMRQINELKLVHFSNVGLCHLKLGNTAKVITYCSKVRQHPLRGAALCTFPAIADRPARLTRALLGRAHGHARWAACVQALGIDPSNVKCLFRRGKCRLDVGDLDGARGDLHQVQRLDSGNREVVHELKRLKALSAEHDKQESRKYSKMFAGPAAKDPQEPGTPA